MRGDDEWPNRYNLRDGRSIDAWVSKGLKTEHRVSRARLRGGQGWRASRTWPDQSRDSERPVRQHRWTIGMRKVHAPKDHRWSGDTVEGSNRDPTLGGSARAFLDGVPGLWNLSVENRRGQCAAG